MSASSTPRATPSSEPRVCVVTGSSVAAGWSASNKKGWAQHLGDHLTSQGWVVHNVAKHGADARLTIDRFPEHVASKSPALVIIGLGLWNERINQRGRKSVLALLSGYIELISMCHAIGARVMLGGVYPNQRYNENEYALLLETHRELQSWKEKMDVPAFDFLSHVDDGSGHWFADMMADFIHPNDLGHLTLFRNIDLGLFEESQPSLTSETTPFPKARL